MQLIKFIKSALIWLPSIVLALIFIENGCQKVFNPIGVGKIIDNPVVLTSVGLILIVSAILFILPRTMLIGASVMALYMTMITFIHLMKGKSFEVTAMIVVGVAFASFIRKPELFQSK